MMGSQQFCLRWNNHPTNMLKVFEDLLANESLVDVTLACEGSMLKAHKVVLSACSSFFHNVFQNNPCQHPVIFLKDIRFNDLKTLVNFMYKGEANVSQEELPHLISIAESLKVKGLTQMEDEPDESNTEQTTQSRLQTSERNKSHQEVLFQALKGNGETSENIRKKSLANKNEKRENVSSKKDELQHNKTSFPVVVPEYVESAIKTEIGEYMEENSETDGASLLPSAEETDSQEIVPNSDNNQEFIVDSSFANEHLDSEMCYTQNEGTLDQDPVSINVLAMDNFMDDHSLQGSSSMTGSQSGTSKEMRGRQSSNPGFEHETDNELSSYRIFCRPLYKRSRLTLKEKREICNFKRINPLTSIEDLRAMFSKKFKTRIARTTMYKIMQNEDSLMSVDVDMGGSSFNLMRHSAI